MDIRKVKKLIELLEESGIAEIEISEGEESVRISRYPGGAGAPQPYFQYAPAPQMQVAAAAPVAALAAAPATAPAAAAAASKADHTVTAPMVGTFYASATPGAKPFVDIGSEVNVGDTLCIIEAMKVFNTICAERDGVVEIVVSGSGGEVEAGQLLMRIV